jgi:hypothetical protein
MPGPVLHAGAGCACPHGAPLQIVPSGPRVLVGGAPAAVLTDQGLVAGCPFMVAQKPQPCATTRWTAGATRVTSMGQPVLVGPPVAIVQSADQIPAGPPTLSSCQSRVIAT